MGELADRLCGRCGADPCLGLEAPAEFLPTSSAAAPTAEEEKPGGPDNRRSRNGKHRKGRYLMVKLVGGWMLVLVLIVCGARRLWQEDDTANHPTAAAPKSTALSNEDMAFLNAAAAKCGEAFTGFLAADTPESRNQFVLTPVRTSTRMAHFYELNPMTHIDDGSLQMAASEVLDLPGGKAVNTQWNSLDGRKIEAVFCEENGEWRLDWEHYARYSDYPWALFLAGSGDSEGEFRLLARERLADEHKTSETISLVLYAPRFGQPGEVGFQSPEFMVSRASPEGQLLDAAFKLTRRGGQVFGSTLKNLNPEGMIRVRLKVARSEVNLERKFTITKVLACHWYAVDEPGVTPTTPPAR